MGMLKQMISAVAAITHGSKPTPPQLTDAALGTEQYADDAPIASSTEDRFSRWPFAERSQAFTSCGTRSVQIWRCVERP